MPYGTLNADTITNSNGLSGNAIGPGFKNRIINGDMRIDQRNAGAAVTINSSTVVFPVDRFTIFQVSDGVLSAQQDTSAPTGFVNSLKITTTTADASLSSAQYASVYQPIEGFNTADLGWGTANAKTVTVSFWVRSSLTGTFGASFLNGSLNRSYPFTYSISVADTWEQKTITVAGDTSGTWLTTNGVGIYCLFSLGSGTDREGTANAWNTGDKRTVSGAVSVIGTLNATWYITGVQLEVAPSATSFDYRPFGTELALCQRYFYNTGGDSTFQVFATGQAYSTSQVNGLVVPLPVSMRAIPTFSISDISHFALQNSSGSGGVVSALSQDANEASSKCGSIRATRSAAGLTGGHAAVLGANNTTSARLNWSSEL
jgi:hypothetical protein